MPSVHDCGKMDSHNSKNLEERTRMASTLLGRQVAHILATQSNPNDDTCRAFVKGKWACLKKQDGKALMLWYNCLQKERGWQAKKQDWQELMVSVLMDAIECAQSAVCDESRSLVTYNDGIDAVSYVLTLCDLDTEQNERAVAPQKQAEASAAEGKNGAEEEQNERAVAPQKQAEASAAEGKNGAEEKQNSKTAHDQSLEKSESTNSKADSVRNSKAAERQIDKESNVESQSDVESDGDVESQSDVESDVESDGDVESQSGVESDGDEDVEEQEEGKERKSDSDTSSEASYTANGEEGFDNKKHSAKKAANSMSFMLEVNKKP